MFIASVIMAPGWRAVFQKTKKSSVCGVSVTLICDIYIDFQEFKGEFKGPAFETISFFSLGIVKTGSGVSGI